MTHFSLHASKLALPASRPILPDMRKFHYTLYREDSDYVAQCLDFDVSSFGKTREEALRMLKEAVELYLEDDDATETVPRISELTVGEFAIV